MRTTLTIDDALLKKLKDLARRTGRPFKDVVNDILRAGLEQARRPPRQRYRLKPASLGGVLPGVDMDKALRAADDLEDVAIARKLDHRK